MAAVKIAPEMMIDKAEAQMLARAITDVQEHYGFDVSPEATLWINLVTALGTVYGPRIVTITSRRKKEKNKGSEQVSRPQPSQQPQKGSKPEPTPFINIPGMHAPVR